VKIVVLVVVSPQSDLVSMLKLVQTEEQPESKNKAFLFFVFKKGKKERGLCVNSVVFSVTFRRVKSTHFMVLFYLS
jgi:hypothetical protein